MVKCMQGMDRKRQRFICTYSGSFMCKYCYGYEATAMQEDWSKNPLWEIMNNKAYISCACYTVQVM